MQATRGDCIFLLRYSAPPSLGISGRSCRRSCSPQSCAERRLQALTHATYRISCTAPEPTHSQPHGRVCGQGTVSDTRQASGYHAASAPDASARCCNSSLYSSRTAASSAARRDTAAQRAPPRAGQAHIFLLCRLCCFRTTHLSLRQRSSAVSARFPSGHQAIIL